MHNILLDLLTNEKPDERQIMTYVSCYYHAFQGAMQVEDLALPVITGLAETEGSGVCRVFLLCFLCCVFNSSASTCLPEPPKIAGGLSR